MNTWENFKETNLPIDLLVWVVGNRIIKPSILKTYFYIKLEFGDRKLLSDEFYQKISIGLNINIKTAKVHIKLLRKANFIGFDAVTNTLYIRSKYTIVPKCFRKTRYKVKLTQENLKHFPEFIVAAIVACIGKRLKQKAKHGPALINDDALRGLSFATYKHQRHHPISLSYLGNCLNKSVGWVNKFKKKAEHLKLISVKHNLISTEIPWENRFSYMSYQGISFGRAKKFRGKLHVVGTDLLLSSVYIFKGKKV